MRRTPPKHTLIRSFEGISSRPVYFLIVHVEQRSDGVNDFASVALGQERREAIEHVMECQLSMHGLRN